MDSSWPIIQYIESIPDDEFYDGFYESIKRHNAFATIATEGVEKLDWRELRDLHQFLVRNGVPVYREIRKGEIACACSIMRTRAMRDGKT